MKDVKGLRKYIGGVYINIQVINLVIKIVNKIKQLKEKIRNKNHNNKTFPKSEDKNDCHQSKFPFAVSY